MYSAVRLSGAQLKKRYYLYYYIILHRLLSASSDRPLRSSNKLELLVPHTRTAMAHSWSFTSIGPSLWNALSPSTRSRILASNLSSTFALKFLKTFFLWPCALGAPLNGSPYERRF